jgi:hypothetical protein
MKEPASHCIAVLFFTCRGLGFHLVMWDNHLFLFLLLYLMFYLLFAHRRQKSKSQSQILTKSHFMRKDQYIANPPKFDKNPETWLELCELFRNASSHKMRLHCTVPDAMSPPLQRGVTYRGRGPLAVSSPRGANTRNYKLQQRRVPEGLHLLSSPGTFFQRWKFCYFLTDAWRIRTADHTVTKVMDLLLSVLFQSHRCDNLVFRMLVSCLPYISTAKMEVIYSS